MRLTRSSVVATPVGDAILCVLHDPIANWLCLRVSVDGVAVTEFLCHPDGPSSPFHKPLPPYIPEPE